MTVQRVTSMSEEELGLFRMEDEKQNKTRLSRPGIERGPVEPPKRKEERPRLKRDL